MGCQPISLVHRAVGQGYALEGCTRKAPAAMGRVSWPKTLIRQAAREYDGLSTARHW
jgi:hypothetical protein